MTDTPGTTTPELESPTRRRRSWRRRLVRLVLWMTALFAMVVFAAVISARSERARELLRGVLEDELSRGFQRPVSIGSLGYGFLAPRFEIGDVTVAGLEAGDLPVFQARSLRVEAGLLDLFRRRWRVRQLEVIAPVLRLEVDAEGEVNLPRWRETGGGRGVRIDALVVEGGFFEMDDLRVPLDFRTQELRARLLDDGPNALAGQVTARDVLIRLPGAEPYSVEIVANGRFGPRSSNDSPLPSLPTEIVPEGIEAEENEASSPAPDGGGVVQLSEVRISGDDFTAAIGGQVLWETAAEEEGASSAASSGVRAFVSLQIDARGRAELFRRLGYVDEDVSGSLRTRGRLVWRAGTWRFDGSVGAPRLRWADFRVDGLEGDVRVDAERLRLELDGGRYAGGELAAWIGADLADPELPVEVDVDLRDLDVDQVLADRGLPLNGFGCRLDGEIDYRSTRTDRGRGSGWGQLYVQPREGAPIRWTGDLPFVIDDGTISSSALLLTAEEHRVVFSGGYDLSAQYGIFDFRADTRQAGALADRLLPYLGGDSDAAWVPRSGVGSIEGQLRFADETKVDVDLNLDLESVTTAEITGDRLRGSLRGTGQGVENLNVEMTRRGGALLITGRVEAGRDGVGRVGAPGNALVALALDAVDWPLAEVRSWRSLELPLDGFASGRLSLDGGPENLQGRFIGSIPRARLWDLPVERLDGEVRWDRREVLLEEIDVVSEAGTLTVGGVFDLEDQSLDFDLAPSSLSLAADPLGGYLGGRVEGRMEVAGRLTGTADKPAGVGSIRFSDVVVAGRPLEDEEHSLDLRWREDRLQVEGSLLGLVEIRGGGALADSGLDLSLDVGTEQLRTLAEWGAGRPLKTMRGRAEGAVRVQGDLRQPQSVTWSLTLPEVSGSWNGLTLEQLEPVEMALVGDRLRIRSFFLGQPGTDSEIFAAGTLGLSGARELDVNLLGKVESRWLEPWLTTLELPPDLDLQGEMEFLGNLAGTMETPHFDGQGRAEVEPFVAPYLPQAVEGLSAQLSFYRDRLELENLTAQSGDGGVRARGTMEFLFDDPNERRWVSRFYGQARGLKLLFPDGWLQEGDADLFWNGESGGRQEIQGTVELEQVRYLEDVDVGLAQVIQELLEPERVDVGMTEGWLTETELNLVVQAPNALRVRNQAANLRGDLELEVRGNLSRPVVLGTVNLQPGGKLRYEDNEYTVERGLVTFNNPFSYEPVIDLVATSRVRLYEVRLALSGTPDKLDFDVSSDPPLPQLDVIALVAGGRLPGEGAEQAAPDPRDEGQLNAGAFLYGQAASAITDRVNTLFGFDKFRVDPLAEGSDTVSSVRVTVGKRLSKDLFVSYSRDPSTTEQDILEAEWQVSPQLVLVFTQNGDGSFSVDALWDRRF